MAISRRNIVLMVLAGVGLAALAPLAAVAYIVFVAQPVRNLGTGMAPTYNDGDRLLLDKTRREYERGDVVAFRFPRDTSKSMLKRIVGLPGDEVSIRNGTTFINGLALDEPYVSPELNEQTRDLEPERVPQGHYFVMGDNRDHSNDSRFWGTVPEALIYGVVLFRYG